MTCLGEQIMARFQLHRQVRNPYSNSWNALHIASGSIPVMLLQNKRKLRNNET